ncbi:hypothetical protein [Bacillus kwashiorkori]|uniref:hypothetical protein n=1 Tax=Bacillus kwashiorkori TaxID=1522318 RepID=UPI00078378ED|nr:hypothetical protein [Bacillus kwashiorkori]
MAVQKFQDYSGYIKIPSLPQVISDNGYVRAEWNETGVMMKQPNQEIKSVKGIISMFKGLKDGESVDNYFHDVFISYNEMISIRRIVSSMGGRKNFKHSIQIKGKNNTIVVDTTTLTGEQWSKLINACLYFNRSLEIDQIIMKIYVNKKIPAMYATRKMVNYSKQI